MTSFDAGSVVEVPFPFLDVPVRKRRPALVLSVADVGGGDNSVVLAMITSAKRSSRLSDVRIRDLTAAGLRANSVVRWKVFSLGAEMVLAVRGALAPADRTAVSAAFRNIFPICEW